MKYYLAVLTTVVLLVTCWCLIEEGPTAVPHFDWYRYGTKVRADLSHASTVSERALVHTVVESVAEQLAQLGVEPNVDAEGRERSRVKYGDANIGTCGQTATALKWALLGAGISESRVKTMQVTQFEDRSNPNFDHLNHIHAALVYLDDQPTAFDLWLHGQAKTTFAGYQADGPAAIPLAGWLRKMSADAYLSVRCTEHTELYGFLPTLDPDQWIGKVRTTPLSHRYTDHIPTPRASK